MNTTNPHSTVIEQMRRQLLARLAGQDLAAPPSPEAPSPLRTIGLEAHLNRLITNRRLAHLLGNKDPDEIKAAFAEIAVLLARIGYHWRGALARKAQRNQRVVRRSRSSMQPAMKRGRPRGAQNFAARQLGLGLAVIWSEHTGRPPSRYEPGLESRRPSYMEFVAAIAAAVPLLFRKSTASELPSVEYLVRTSSRDFQAALAAPDEYRRRGLIDEHLWLDRDVRNAPPVIAR
jgi:hypothetical protein